MLDRTIPFLNIILKCNNYRFTENTIPNGFSIVPYHIGYEKEWAKLETTVGDFENVEEAEQYFTNTYMRDKEKLKEDVLFLLNENGQVIGSCIAWEDMKENVPIASLHWLIVDEKYQGMGLGKVLCREVMNVFYKQSRMPVYIHTQPWSYKAIFLYLALGFKIQKTDTFSKYNNQYSEMVQVMKKIVSDERYQRLIELSED